MYKRMLNKLNGDGIIGLFNAAYRLVFPPMLSNYSKFLPYLDSKIGLEIGGPSEKFSNRGLLPVYGVSQRIDNINFSHFTTFEGEIEAGKTFVFNSKKDPGMQYIAEASDLSFLENGRYDFLISSHCIEHIANPLAALQEWVRVISDKGLMILIIPHKDGTFDRNRPITDWSHMLEDLNRKTGEEDQTHVKEVLNLHDIHLDSSVGSFEELYFRISHNLTYRNMHHHVFNTPLALQMFDFVGMKILEVELFPPCHIVVVAEKPERPGHVDNHFYLRADGDRCWDSPFPSDQI